MRCELDVLPGRLTVARLEPSAPIPAWAATAAPVAVTRTAGELSILAPEALVPGDVARHDGLQALAVRGPLDFGTTGLLAALLEPLARAGVPVFAISTFDTDLVLVPQAVIDEAIAALRQAGHHVAGR